MRLVRLALQPVVAVLIVFAMHPRLPAVVRIAAGGLVVAFWSLVYARYRAGSRARTKQERELLGRVRWDAFWRHYNEQVPTIEEEFEIWGEYHEHRHRMRYGLISQAADDALPDGGRILDIGCGSAMVADRLSHRDATYVGIDFGEPHVAFAARKVRSSEQRLAVSFLRGDAERLPFADDSFDVVVMSEVIEHLIQPELAVWEVSRVLRRGGIFVMTTNNACETPQLSPLTHPFVWIEKALGFKRPALISRRPWIWPERVDPALLPPGTQDVYIPHTHHIFAETSAMFAMAGLHTRRWSTFEFPPPQSATARWLERCGARGRRIADAIERVATRTPLLRRMGTHVMIVAERAGERASAAPPPGVWPGPLSDGSRGPSLGAHVR